MSKNKLTRIYVVRHAQSEGNAGIIKKKKQELGSSLTKMGVSQAQLLAENIKNIDFEAIFSSDMLRTRQTAEILTLERKLAVQASNLIRERSFEHYLKKLNRKTEEKLKEEMKKVLIKLNEKGKMQYKHSPQMESAEEGALRLLTFIREASLAFQGKNILVVAHGNIMRSLLVHLEFVKYDELPEGTIENTGYFVLESDGVDFFVKETFGIAKQQNTVRLF